MRVNGQLYNRLLTTLRIFEGAVDKGWQGGLYYGLSYEYPLGWERRFLDNAGGTEVLHIPNVEQPENLERGVTIYHPSFLCIVSDQRDCWYGEVVVTNEDNVLRNGEEGDKMFAYKQSLLDIDPDFSKTLVTVNANTQAPLYSSESSNRHILLLKVPIADNGISYIEILFQNISENDMRYFLRSLKIAE